MDCNQYVRIIALDFSKAFDTVRHQELCRKLAEVPVGDQVYNWIVSYIENRSHYTRAGGETSTRATINSSVVQGSAIGPVAFIINARDLKAASAGNVLLKYADNTYLIVPSSNDFTIDNELTNISQWAQKNDLNLNRSKSQEIIIREERWRNTGADNWNRAC